MYEGRTEGEDISGRPPAKWISRVDELWGELAGKGLNVLRSAEINKIGDPCHGHPLRSSNEGAGH